MALRHDRNRPTRALLLGAAGLSLACAATAMFVRISGDSSARHRAEAGLLLASATLGAACALGAVHALRRRAEQLLPAVERIRAEGGESAPASVPHGDDAEEVARWVLRTADGVAALRAQAAEGDRRVGRLVDAIGEGFLTLGAEDRVLHANERAAAILGQPARPIVGRRLDDLLTPESAATWRAHAAEPHEANCGRIEVAWASDGAAGVRTLLACVPLRDAAGRRAGSYLVFTSLTGRARGPDEAARAEKSRALAEMAGSLTHDFNNVLTAILGNVQYLLLDELPESARATLREIEQAALDGSASVRRVRSLCQPRTIVPASQLVDLAEVAECAVADARTRWQSGVRDRGVRYEVVLACQCSRGVRGSADELREALTNIVENAVEAMPGGGRLAVEVFDEGEDSVAVRVEDTGIGLTPEQSRRVFDAFYSTKTRGRCSGLGLPIANAIVQSHRGRIEVRSAPGAGSAFTVILPAADDEVPAPTVARTPVQPRILVAGGEAIEVQSLLDDLASFGLRAAAARLASVVPLLADGGLFNVLFLEHRPEAPAWDVAREARALRPDLRIVILASAPDDGDAARARAEGIDSVLPRPFDSRDVHAEAFAVLAAAPARAVPAPRPDAPPAPLRKRKISVTTSEVWESGTPPPDAPAPEAAPAAADPMPTVVRRTVVAAAASLRPGDPEGR